MRKNTYSGLLDVRAWCDDCGFEQLERNAVGLAAIHADRNPEHTVHAESTIGVTYNRKPERQP